MHWPNSCWCQDTEYEMYWGHFLLFPWQQTISVFNTLRPRQNGRRFADDTFKRNFLNENVRISIKISLEFVPKGPINNIPALVQIMVWRRSGDKPLSEPMMISLLTHICVTRHRWLNIAVGHATLEWNIFTQQNLCNVQYIIVYYMLKTGGYYYLWNVYIIRIF